MLLGQSAMCNIGKAYVERIPGSKRGFEHLTKREDMVISQDGHSLLR